MDSHIGRELVSKIPNLPNGKLKMWKITDPFGDDLSEYERCAQKIHRKLKEFVKRLE